MDVCKHCHNVLPRTVDRCTVCGTARLDPNAGDTRRREGDAPSHAPGWAQSANDQSDTSSGLHVDDFLEELTGEAPSSSGVVNPLPAPSHPTAAPATPPTGALAGYLGTTVDRSETRPPAPTPDEVMPGAGLVDDRPPAAAPVADHGVHLSTASKISPDGVAARTTRLDGTVKLGATDKHQLLTLGVPLAAAVLLIGGVVGTYRIGASVAEAEERAAQVQVEVDTAAVTQTRSAVVLLDLDGCGIIDQATGFLFADQTILVPREAVLTDHRPTVVTDDGTSHTAVITGWSVTRDIAVIRADDRLAGGLRWGVSSRVRAGDSVSLLAVTGSGIATPVATTIETANTLDGRNVTFELGTSAAQGSVVLDGDGFVIGVVGADGLAQASDDLSPAISRIVLDNERPQSVCPPPPTTLPPTTVPTEDGADGATGEDAGAADKGAATGGDTDG